MSGIRNLLTSERDVAVFPDPETARLLHRARECWNTPDKQVASDEPDLAALSDAEIADLLASNGVTDTEVPAHIRDLTTVASRRWSLAPGFALAACLAGGVAVGISILPDLADHFEVPATDQAATSDPGSETSTALDPYLFPQREAPPEVAMPNPSGPDLRTVRLPGSGARLDLDRAEMRELQMLLNRFDYGPVAQLGLPSADTSTAVAQFRAAHGLAEGGADRVVLDLLRELAHEQALENLKKSFQD